MLEIKDFGMPTSQFVGTEEQLLTDPQFLKVKQIFEYLEEHGECHVRVTGGDYDGSIAKFKIDKEIHRRLDCKLYKRMYSREEQYNLRYCWHGRLSWKGKRNNPKFTLMNSTCEVLLGYEGEENLKRFDLKKEAKKLLETQQIGDIDGNLLSVGDKVLYMNLRYGCGGKLCKGVVKEFKAHARDGYLSVIVERIYDRIENPDSTESSELHYPHMQIFKM